jgi:hypothetical protein
MDWARIGRHRKAFGMQEYGLIPHACSDVVTVLVLIRELLGKTKATTRDLDVRDSLCQSARPSTAVRGASEHTFQASSNPQLRTQCSPGASTESTIRWQTVFHMSFPFTLSQSLPSASYFLQMLWQTTVARPSLMACPSSGRVCRRAIISATQVST